MFTEMILDKAHELEDEHPFIAGFIQGTVDGAFVVGSSLAVVGCMIIIGNKLTK